MNSNNIFDLIVNKLVLFFYINKHLIIYILIGIFSIFCELIIKNNLIVHFNLLNISSPIAFIFGVLICFTLNFLFNFNVPKFYFFKSLFYFFIISFFSYSFQFLISSFDFLDSFSFAYKRYLISGCFFLFFYFLHVKYSFQNLKKIGVALYPNNNINLDKIYKKIANYPDFIHIDLVDSSMNKNADLINYNNILKIRKFWTQQEIHFHIMSKKPLAIIKDIIKENDIIFFHADIEENVIDVIKFIKSKKASPGIVIHVTKEQFSVDKYLGLINEYLLLCIENPGYSGQQFISESIKILKKLNDHPLRKKFKVSVDGGITTSLMPYLNSDRVISSSQIFNNLNPKKQIIKLKTFSRYKR